ncbi:MAG: ABC-type transport system substrate-binding protein [Bacteriovoracaceae bacterium]|jgi:ABC-type transport system substrate-binding protein
MRFILGVLIMINLTANVEASTAINVVVGENGKMPYLPSSPVQSLMTIQSAVLGQLIYTESSFDLKPGLLESYKWDYDDKSYILKLRSNLVFHNGRKATSQDLEFSILRGFFTPKGTWFKSFFNNIEGIDTLKNKKVFKSGLVKGVKIIDPLRIKVKLKRPNPSFLHSIARTTFSLVPIEEMNSDYDSWKSYPIGCGNYKVTKTDTKNNVHLEYIGSKESAAKKIILTSNGTSESSDIILTNPSLSKSIEMFHSKNAARVTSIYFNYSNSLVKNSDFRKAIDILLDRDELAHNVDAYKPTREFLASHFWGRLEKYDKRDIKLAKRLFSSIKGLDLTKTYQIPVYNSFYGNKLFGKYLDTLENQFNSVGLKVAFYETNEKFLKPEDNQTLFKILSMGADVVDPTVLFSLIRSPFKQHFPVEDKKYYDLLEKAESAHSLDQRVIALKAMSKHLYQNKYVVPLFERKSAIGINKNKIESLGQQNGGITFYLDRIKVQ